MYIRLVFLTVLATISVSCRNERISDMDANAMTLCDTSSFSSLESDVSTGILIKNQARVKIRSITVYSGNTAPFSVEFKSVSNSEPNRIYSREHIENISDESILCSPSCRGFYTADLTDYGISVRGDIFIIFRSASTKGKSPCLARYLHKPEERFLAVSMNKGIAYSDVAGIEAVPVFVSIDMTKTCPKTCREETFGYEACLH